MAFFVSASGISSGFLASNYHVRVPTFQSFALYALLSFFLLPTLSKERDRRKLWHLSSYTYLPIAIVDVEANFFVVLAFQFTDVSSVLLLDCWAIPCVMLISHYFLKLRFEKLHFIGAACCVCGILVLVVSDWIENGIATGQKNAIYGDLFILIGATLYGISNVAQETMVSFRPQREFLGMLGFYGAILSLGQTLLLERNSLLAIEWSTNVVLLLLLFVGVQFASYTLAPTMLKIAGSTFFNISLLSSDTFAMIVSVAFFGRQITAPYVISSLTILAGIIIYQFGAEPKRLQRKQPQQTQQEGEQDQEQADDSLVESIASKQQQQQQQRNVDEPKDNVPLLSDR